MNMRTLMPIRALGVEGMEMVISGTRAAFAVGSILSWIILIASSAHADQLVSGGAGAQDEPSIVVNPINPMNIVITYQDFTGGGSTCATAASQDGGQTFVRNVVPLQGFGVGSEPRVAFDKQGRAYVSCELFNPNTFQNRITVSTSTDGGLTFGPPATVVNSTETPDFNDNPFLFVGTNPTNPFAAGNVFATWTGPSPTGNLFEVARSMDGGQTWSPPQIISGFAGNMYGATGTSGANGGVFVAGLDVFNQCQIVAPTPTFCAFSGARSTNGGSTFLPPRPITTIVNIPSPLSPFNFATNSFPRLATSPADGSSDIIWNDFQNGDSDVFMMRSTDGGNTWGPSIRVNQDPVGNGRQQFFPQVTVAPDGTIFTSWYDNRVDPAKLDVFVARSPDQGATWFEQRVSAVSSNPNTNEFPNNSRWGDYMGLAVSETAVYSAWTDTRNGTQDIFMKRLPANPNALALGLGIDRSVLTGGQPVVLSAELLNGLSAPPVVVDFLIGGLQPNGNSMTFLKDLSGGQATGTLTNPASWTPILSNVMIQPGMDVVVPQLLQYTPSGPGIHTLFFAARVSGTSNNIQALSFKSVLVQ